MWTGQSKTIVSWHLLLLSGSPVGSYVVKEPSRSPGRWDEIDEWDRPDFFVLLIHSHAPYAWDARRAKWDLLHYFPRARSYLYHALLALAIRRDPFLLNLSFEGPAYRTDSGYRTAVSEHEERFFIVVDVVKDLLRVEP